VKRKRVAVSELVGTLIMVGITLSAGAAVFGWINGQAGASENAYGASVASNVNFLRERFVIVASNFTSCSGTSPSRSCSTLGVYLYNNGQLTDNISRITISTPPGVAPQFSLTFGSKSTTGSCPIPAIAPNQKLASNLMPVQSLRGYTVTVPNCQSSDYMVVGQSYLVTVYGLYGSIVPMEVQAVG